MLHLSIHASHGYAPNGLEEFAIIHRLDRSKKAAILRSRFLNRVPPSSESLFAVGCLSITRSSEAVRPVKYGAARARGFGRFGDRSGAYRTAFPICPASIKLLDGAHWAPHFPSILSDFWAYAATRRHARAERRTCNKR